jgi:hypothetical protein
MKNGCTLKKYPRNVSKAKVPSTKNTWRDPLPIDMLLSAVSVLVVVQSIFEIPDGLMNNPVYAQTNVKTYRHIIMNKNKYETKIFVTLNEMSSVYLSL